MVQYASAALVIIGIFVMRVIIVIGGQSLHLTQYKGERGNQKAPALGIQAGAF